MSFPNKFILVYHGIGDTNKFLEVSEINFKRQITYLLNKGYVFLPLHKLLTVSQNGLTLIFDDGLSSIKKVYNFLYSNGIHFGVSLVSDKVQFAENSYLSINELKNFYDCEFYSHSKTHRDLTNLSKIEVKEELLQSKKRLEENFNIDIDTFVYPFGKYNNLVIDEAKKAGYSFGLTLLPFHLDFFRNNLTLPRININGYLGLSKFKFLISGVGNLYLKTAYAKRKLLRQSYLK